VNSLRSLSLFGFSLLSGLAFVAPGCATQKTDDGDQSSVACENSGGPVEDGSVDMHCVDPASGDPIVQSVGQCMRDIDQSGGTAGAGGTDGTNGAAGAGSGGETHPVLTSHAGADDDCKYDVSFTSSCVQVGKDATFRVTLTTRADGSAATGAHPDSPEVFLESDPSHISPSVAIAAPEDPAGTYTIGPIDFDQPGRWVVRFHFYEACSDLPSDSPHGHVAFYIDVP
jgi:hypothetical protein